MIRTGRRLSLAFACALLALLVWADGGVPGRHTLTPPSIQPAGGHEFLTGLGRPFPLTLFVHDDAAHSTASTAQIFENGRPLGPGHANRDVIHNQGLGAYSHWGLTLSFSTSDNSDPTINGRTYVVHASVVPSEAAHLLVLALLAGALVLNLDLAWALCRRIGRRLARIPGVRWFWVNVMPGLVITAVLIAVVGAAGEIWIRHKAGAHFTEVKWPGTWNPEMSFVFQPHSVIQYTNHLDYWTRTETNRFGFPDRDWSPVRAPGDRRVAFVGDSFVESVQVPIEDKFHILFEQEANRTPGLPHIETAAFGISGTGQTNQIPFFRLAAREFHPDVMVLVVVGNDFANNSALLECVRNGWNPDHLPRPFFVRKHPGDPFELAPMDPHWAEYLLPDGSKPQGELSRLGRTHQMLMREVFFYAWAIEAIELHFPKLARYLPQTPTSPALQETYAARIAALRHLPGYEHSLDGWNYPNDWDFDGMFGTRDLPPVFQEAIAATGKTLDVFAEQARREHFQLAILTDQGLSAPQSNGQIEKITGNPPVPKAYLRRFQQLAEKRGIPVIDFGAYLDKRKIARDSVHWPHDSHWAEAGHQWVAQMLVEAFQAHPEWFAPNH